MAGKIRPTHRATRAATLLGAALVLAVFWFVAGGSPALESAAYPSESPAVEVATKNAAANETPRVPHSPRHLVGSLDPLGGQRTIRVSFTGGRLPDQWDFIAEGVHMLKGPIAHLDHEPKSFPVRLRGEWRGVVIWQVVASECCDVVAEPTQHYAITVVAPPYSDGVERWVCYTSRPEQDARLLSFEKHVFGECGELKLTCSLGQARTVAVWAPGQPMFLRRIPEDPRPEPWSEVRVDVERAVAAPIQGRVVDRRGRPVADVAVRVTSVFPEAWGNGDYMVLDLDRTRAMGGFAGDVAVDCNGAFAFPEPAAATGQPFVIQVVGDRHKLVDPDRPQFTTRGGTWVDVVVD